jgi:AcrR family transcriptional regulator
MAVAEAVALAGPWNASMEMVAMLSGLSKSGLYAHFKSKGDMLSKLFTAEFGRIAELAVKYAGLSERREERLYLVLFSIAEYLRKRPDILIVLDWIRIQRLELDLSAPPDLYKFSEDLKFVFGPGENPQENFKWILFLLIAVLMHMRQDRKKEPSNESIRIIYRFITLGIEGLHDDVPKI